MPIEPGICVVLSLIVGSIPFGWIVAKIWGIDDLRKVGSSNIGATNVVRTVGWLPGALTFGLDFAKGFFPVFYFPSVSYDAENWATWFGLAAMLGHCYSPFMKFMGGKGVSTTLGAITAFNSWLGLGSIVTYSVALTALRISAMGSFFAMLTIVSCTALFTKLMTDKLAIGLMVAIVLVRHHENWDKLLGRSSLILGAFVAGGISAILGLTALPNGASAAAGHQVVDFRQKTFWIAQPPRRIVALMPHLAEIVAELGSADRIVGVPAYTRLPSHLRPASIAGIAHIKILGPYNMISAEAVYATHPDLVLASMDGNDAQLVQKLEAMGLRVLTVNTISIADILKTSHLVAKALAISDSPSLSRLEKALASPHPTKSGRHPKVFVQVGWDPLVTVSKGTFISEVVERAGGGNLFEDSRLKYPRPTTEEVIRRNPDVIIICQLTDSGFEAEKARHFWQQFTSMRAVREQKIFVLPGDWIAKPGFNLVRGIEEMRKIL